jgi:hypothetical protein
VPFFGVVPSLFKLVLGVVQILYGFLAYLCGVVCFCFGAANACCARTASVVVSIACIHVTMGGLAVGYAVANILTLTLVANCVEPCAQDIEKDCCVRRRRSSPNSR